MLSQAIPDRSLVSEMAHIFLDACLSTDPPPPVPPGTPPRSPGGEAATAQCADAAPRPPRPRCRAPRGRAGRLWFRRRDRDHRPGDPAPGGRGEPQVPAEDPSAVVVGGGRGHGVAREKEDVLPNPRGEKAGEGRR